MSLAETELEVVVGTVVVVGPVGPGAVRGLSFVQAATTAASIATPAWRRKALRSASTSTHRERGRAEPELGVVAVADGGALERTVRERGQQRYLRERGDGRGVGRNDRQDRRERANHIG